MPKCCINGKILAGETFTQKIVSIKTMKVFLKIYPLGWVYDSEELCFNYFKTCNFGKKYSRKLLSNHFDAS